MLRYFRRVSTGLWYAGRHQSTAFADNGQPDADRIASACGFAVGDVEPITLADTAPDPRVAPTFAEAVAPYVDPLTPKQRAALTRLSDFVSHDVGTTGADVDAYLAAAAPTQAQTVAAIKLTLRIDRAIATMLHRVLSEILEEV